MKTRRLFNQRYYNEPFNLTNTARIPLPQHNAGDGNNSGYSTAICIVFVYCTTSVHSSDTAFVIAGFKYFFIRNRCTIYKSTNKYTANSNITKNNIDKIN